MSENSKFGSFEDLKVWQASRILAAETYRVSRLTPLSKDYGFKDQLCRAAVSVMNNIAEGYERGRNKEHINFLYIARGSCGEVRSMLHIAKDLNYIDDNSFKKLYALCIEISKMIWGLSASIKKREEAL